MVVSTTASSVDPESVMVDVLIFYDDDSESARGGFVLNFVDEAEVFH